MCGICGIYKTSGATPKDIGTMLETISHRGPDDEGIHIGGSVGLGSRRLSIIDLPNGHQPICNEDGSIWIVFNGEIYNYKELRRTLESKGHLFKTNSDTEVIVHLYEDRGEHCLESLRGMFAFAIWDSNKDKLLLARDHLGQKPLFYSLQDNQFLFASEVKAILRANGHVPEVDYESIHHYLSLRFIPAPGTMFRNIKKLPPAHYLIYQDGTVHVKRYWQLSFQDKLSLPEAEYVVGLREKLTSTVRSHLVSDVPVGAFLSGGMDSSMIVAMMARSLPNAFNTFAIGVTEQDFDELPYARQVAEHVDSRHIEASVQANLIGLLPKMIWHLDEPSDPIAACMYHAAELASRHVKVVLGGDGGDELFAGFDRYLGLRYIDYYAMIPAPIRRNVLGSLINLIPDSFGYKSMTQKLRWVHQLAEPEGAGKRYAAATTFFRFDHQGKRDLFNSDVWSTIGHLYSADIITEQYNDAPADSPLDRMLYADYMTRLPEHSLMLTDRMTMAHGLEARSPFLDPDLVSYVATFPTDLKIRDRDLKYVLRKLARDYLPAEIVTREKQGFMFPIAYWFQRELYPLLETYLMGSFFVNAGIFRPAAITQMLEEHKQGRVDNHVRLWMLLSLELWHQIYIQQNDVASVSENMQSLIPNNLR